MNPIVTSDIQEVMKAVHYRPAVSIILPFEPKVNMKTGLIHSLKIAADKVEKQLSANYPAELASLVINKLRDMISKLKVDLTKKTLALFVSPVFEKIMFLDLPVEEKIIIDESFEIRDLIYCKKQLHKYLVLLISGKESRLYLGNTDHFVRIVTGTPESVAAYATDSPEKVANFSDSSEQKEIVIDKFLRHIDRSLDSMLKIYQLPVFVLGAERILGHFKKLSKHNEAVSKYVVGNYEESSFAELRTILAEPVANWKSELEKELMNKMQKAADKKELAVGITAVWREAIQQKGRLLIVEKNYMCAAQHGSSPEVIYKTDELSRQPFFIKDAVDDVIEKVLENGGDVEFVEEGLLKDYQHIALVQYY